MNYPIAFFSLFITAMFVFGSIEAEKHRTGFEPSVLLIHEKLQNFNDIVAFDAQIVPIVYRGNIDLSVIYNTTQKKEAFFNLMLPSIAIAKHHVDIENACINSIISKETKVTKKIEKLIKHLKTYYRANTLQELAQKTKTHPVSLPLAQAAIESGWGSSRFFNEAYNAFGIWSFKKSESRIMAGQPRGSRSIFLRKYTSLLASAKDYYRVTSTARAFSSLRKARLNTQDSHKLAEHLTLYSETGQIYVRKLQKILASNGLGRFDFLTLPTEITAVCKNAVANLNLLHSLR